MAEQNKKKGFIALYRSIQDHWIWDSKEFSYFQAWIDLLLTVNHEDKKFMFNGSLEDVKRGSKITSIRQLCERWGWSNNKVNRFLINLESDGMIERKSDTKKTVISIANYDLYQGTGLEKATAKHTKSISKAFQKHFRSTQTTMINNDRTMINNDKQDIRHKHGANENVLLSDGELEKLKERFPFDYQKKIDNLSYYMSSTGKAYKSHYMTILNWARKDEEKQKPKGNIPADEDYYSERSLLN